MRIRTDDASFDTACLGRLDRKAATARTPRQVRSRIDILQVCDGLQLNGEPVKSHSSETGWVWARHYFVKGWIPVRYLLPLDILSEAEVQLRILRDGSYISPPVPLRRTDSLGNLLLDLNDPDPEYRC